MRAEPCRKMSWPTSLEAHELFCARQVAKWVVEVAELPQYEQAFRQQHLDGSGLLRLTTDLRGRDEIHKVLGITDRVHRTQLLAAIRKLELANCRRRELEGPPHPPDHGLGQLCAAC